jgi:proline dehydrogenase
MKVVPSITLENLEQAFAYRNNNEIEKAFWLFRFIGNPFVVNTGSLLSVWALRMHLPVKGLIRNTIFQQFCGGENIDDCAKTVKRIGDFGVGSILDYSVEGKESEAEFDHSCEEILATIRRAENDTNIPFSVFKVTGLARFALLEKVSSGVTLSKEESDEYQRVRDRVNSICKEANTRNVRVFIDAEESWIQTAIDTLATEMMQQYNRNKVIIYNTVQLYRHDRLAFTKDSYEHAVQNNYFLGLKLVRGAYMEKERKRAQEKGYLSPIQPDKASSDRDYDDCLRFCVDHIDRMAICAGTHNEESSLLLTRLMEQKGVEPGDERIYFSQLLGMSDHISFNLAKAGYRVAKYVPYGPVKAVLPYLIRRAQENTSMAGQMSRELTMITKERWRRKKLKR